MRPLCVFSFALFTLPLCLLRDIARLEKAAALTVLSVFFIAATITGELLSRGPVHVPWGRAPAPWGLVQVVGLFSFARGAAYGFLPETRVF